MDSEIKKIAEFLEQRIGLDPGIVHRQTWEHALLERMSKTNHSGIESYHTFLLHSKEELQALLELLVVPETWFFRDPTPYAFIIHYFAKELHDPKLENPVKILSLACSSGEEPYSLAIALKEAGILERNFSIAGIDISHKVIEKAINGVYTKHSFRSKDLSFKEKYFNHDEHHFSLKDSIKKLVHFSHGNAIDPSSALLHQKFDVIFCRNLLIYMSFDARKKIFDLVDQLLNPQGLFIVTPIESEVVRLDKNTQFHHLKNSIFLHKKPDHKAVKKTTLNKILHKAVAIVEKQDISIEELFQLADLGAFDKAEELCYEYLQTHNPSARVYFLLGLIHHAKKQEGQAEEFFQKALYLDPTHYETLVYLALLAERRGDMHKAQLYHKRAQTKVR